MAFHTCESQLCILKGIAGIKPGAMKTFTPPSMDGNTRLGTEIK